MIKDSEVVIKDSEGDFEIKCELFEIRDSPNHFDLD